MKEGIIVTTPEALRELVTEAVETAMQKAGAPHEAPADILNCDQVAALIGVHHDTVPRLVRGKGLPVLGRVGSHLRFSRAAVMAWVTGRDKP